MQNQNRTRQESNSKSLRALLIIALVSATVYLIPGQALANENFYRGLAGAAQLYNQMDQQAYQRRVQGEQQVYQNYLRRQQIQNNSNNQRYNQRQWEQKQYQQQLYRQMLGQ